MRRKPTKSREQKTAEEFFTVEPRDVNFAVEKKYSPMEVEIPTRKETIIEEKVEIKASTKR